MLVLDWLYISWFGLVLFMRIGLNYLALGLVFGFGHERVIQGCVNLKGGSLIGRLGQINNEYFYVLLCVNLFGLVVIDEENMMKIWPMALGNVRIVIYI